VFPVCYENDFEFEIRFSFSFSVLSIAGLSLLAGSWPSPFSCCKIKVSILSTFYLQLFHIKVYFEAFLWLQFGFVIFCCKNIGKKAARKLLMKLT